MKDFTIIIALILFASCKTETGKESVELKSDLKKEIKQELKTELTNFTISEIDSLFDNGFLTKKFYPNMSACGGGLYGFYYNDELKLIDSKYQAELGYSSKKIYWNGNQILKIKYREYFAEWRKYEEKYPPKKDKYDPSKMTYSDTIYEITFGEKYEFKKNADNKLVSIKTDSTLIEKLIDCGKRMKTELESEIDNDYSISAELFVKEVLKENIRTHIFELANSQKPKHLEIFKSDGLQKIVAYSNKNYPKKSEPKYYENFTLFVATYNSQNIARKTFDRVKSDSKYGLSEWRELESDQAERVKALNIGAKPGGMITQIGNQIFSLVETCREVPFGANWIEYENRLIKYLTRTGSEEFGILNSDCGNDRYEFKIIKASR